MLPHLSLPRAPPGPATNFHSPGVCVQIKKGHCAPHPRTVAPPHAQPDLHLHTMSLSALSCLPSSHAAPPLEFTLHAGLRYTNYSFQIRLKTAHTAHLSVEGVSAEDIQAAVGCGCAQGRAWRAAAGLH